jgi:hypothetical protein
MSLNILTPVAKKKAAKKVVTPAKPVAKKKHKKVHHRPIGG